MDVIVDTVSAQYPLLPLTDILKPHGKLVLVGAPEKPLELLAIPLLLGKHCLRIELFLMFYLKIVMTKNHLSVKSIVTHVLNNVLPC